MSSLTEELGPNSPTRKRDSHDLLSFYLLILCTYARFAAQIKLYQKVNND